MRIHSRYVEVMSKYIDWQFVSFCVLTDYYNNVIERQHRFNKFDKFAGIILCIVIVVVVFGLPAAV